MRLSTLTALIAACSVAACGTTYSGSTIAKQVKSWATSSPDPKFATAVAALQGDLQRVVGARASTEQGLARTECDVLVTDALGANQNLPTPDTELTNLLSSAYGSAVSAGQDCFCAAGGHPCRRGASGKNEFAGRASREAAVAQRALIEAQARADELFLSAGDSP